MNDKRYENQFTIPSDDSKKEIAWFGIPITLTNNNKKFKNSFMNKLNRKGIITRPIISGNFAKQPSIKLYKIKVNYKLKNADVIDQSSFFLGLHNIKINKAKLNKFCNFFYSSLN